MMRTPDDIRQIDSRPLSNAERHLIDRLLQERFAGVDAVRTQLAGVCVIEEGTHDTRTLVFAPPAPDAPRADNDARVPVDAVMADEDGASIEILLHVVDGYARELEAYRPDGEPIRRRSLDGPLMMVNWRPVD